MTTRSQQPGVTGDDLGVTQAPSAVTWRDRPAAPDATIEAPPTPPASASGNLARTSLREPPARISGLDQTAISDSAISQQPALSDPAPGLSEPPQRIARYAVWRTLGAGGMGVVYEGFDEELERRVAIKVVRDDVAAASQGSSRILREAQAMAKVSHPNVVQVYEVGKFGDQVFIAMEFIKGVTLTEWLTDEHGWEEILEMHLQAGRGLAAAHDKDLVHRDFKPDNVLVGRDGRARVLDFGLARAEASRSDANDSALVRLHSSSPKVDTQITLAGTIMGTPAFMSPEQHLGRHADARSDQFSFCVAVYGALYGQPPFPGSTLLELSDSVTGGKLQPPPADSPVPAWVFQALKIGLATAPDDRHPSMDTLLAALTPDQVQVSTRRRWVWPAALVGASTLAVLITLMIVRSGDPTGEDLAQIDRLTAEARDAAGRMQWVYPTPADPRDTAYNRVVLLEHFEGPAAEPAFDAASGLRAEFSAALIVLGDRYFDDPASRPYARDYYVQARVFAPDDRRASERAGVTIGQISDLQARAGQGEFAEAELIAAEPLRILADPDRVRASSNALAYARDAARGSALGRDRLQDVFRKQGLIEPGALESADDDREDTKDEPPPLLAVAEPTPEPAPELVPVPEPEPADDLPTRLERDRRLKPRPPAEVKPATPPPTPPPAAEDDPARSDPDASRALSTQADAARRRGDSAGAEKLYNQALDLWNANAAALIGLSDIAFERGNFDRAVKYAEKAVRAEPEKADYLIRLGDAYFKVFRYSDAQARYEKAAALGHAKAAERLTRVREKLGG